MIIYFLLFILIIAHFQQIHSLRCKCNANRGPSHCTGDFCDIHNRNGKRAACGALRRAHQTIFACVLIRQTSNDTYCHVIGSTTASRTMKSIILHKNNKQSIKPKINPAIEIDIAETIKLTPQRQNPPTVITEIISDNYDYTLDEE
ncbi:hypothetical protein LOAG_18085 [Loa loa]|uniref:Uncharacterized protein n=1 Tax=Loa loa TaxID=7209 RepID=A0A1S0UGA5_LOALO|nr:hypothetical protein LOAG_18085 [Loa loa]EJD74619.1 hypothetical protein LOAG_18085 [Loa loa]